MKRAKGLNIPSGEDRENSILTVFDSVCETLQEVYEIELSDNQKVAIYSFLGQPNIIGKYSSIFKPRGLTSLCQIINAQLKNNFKCEEQVADLLESVGFSDWDFDNELKDFRDLVKKRILKKIKDIQKIS